eukprot:jgi/Astpho2/7790/fgenesh1_pm.00117_%23_7_t
MATPDRQLHMMGGEWEVFQPRALSTKAAQQANVLQPSKAAEQATSVAGGRTIHTVCTSNGSPYLNFQTRIMYGTYNKAQQLPGGERLAAFTRILHRTTPDILMDEVPTWRANPLTPRCDVWCEFPVADRPNAVRQWLDAAVLDPSLIKAPWILMIETDYVWLRPPQPPRAEDESQASWGFPFGYITPQEAHLQAVMRRMYPTSAGPLTDIPGSGPAPVMMRAHEWATVTPDWERLAAHIEADLETKELLGWVREMYGFSIATALQGIKLDLQLPPDSQLIAQPPADDGLGKACMFHYTWGTILKDGLGDSPEVWRFDKRDYTDKALEAKKQRWVWGWVLQDSKPVLPNLYSVLEQMVGQMNLAINDLPDLSPSQT